MIAPDEHQSDRFAVEGHAAEGGGARTVIGWGQPRYWRLAAGGARGVVVSVDTTPETAVMLTPEQAVELADALRTAARA